MKRKLFNALLLGALVVSSTSAFVSCKDYDDDIQNLQAQIDANSKAIKEINDLIKSGSVITNVASTSNGVTVTLSDGKSFSLTNGNDGAPGTVWTIGADGYWYKDGEKTSYYALGTKGEQGDKGDKGDKGDDGSDATVTGTFWAISDDFQSLVEYKDGKLTGESLSLESLIGNNNSVSAIMDNNSLILKNVKNAEGGQVVISLNGVLRSLVFKPYIYFDGIETIEYPWLNGNYMTKVASTTFNNYQGKTVEGCDDWKLDTPEFAFGYVKAVDYHINPANANVKNDDVIGFTQLNSDIYYTRSTSPVAKYNDLRFNVSDGILTAGLQIENPNLLNQTPTAAAAQQGLTVAIQAKDNSEENEVITSDYALVMPVKAELKGIAWEKNPDYKKSAAQPVTGDEDCSTGCGKTLVWKSPEGALQNPNGAALELYYDDMTGIKLVDWLAVHYDVEKINDRSAKNHGTILPDEMKFWNLEYEFKLVTDYTVDGNVTGDSKYAKMLDSKTGQIRACNVKADGTEDAQSATAVDREPLVQVLVKEKGTDKVVLDGYILIHITSTPLQAPDNKEVTSYDNDVKEYAWDLCDDENLVVETNWSQFSSYILTQALNNMTKEQFDEYYIPEVTGATYDRTTPAATYTLAQFKEFEKNGNTDPVAADALGTMTYYPNTLGTTNHRFDWTLTAKEIEELTHEKAPGTVITVVRYFRFKAIAPASPYPYVYVKVTAKVKRDPMIEKAFEVKNTNFWYALNGAEDGFDAIIFDVKEPRDGADITVFSNTINSTLTPFDNGTTNVSQPAIKDFNYKYFFIPKTYEITALNGKKYVVTPQKSATDTEWNALVCKYDNTEIHALDLSGKNTRAEIDEVINNVVNTCAIQYNKGVLNNVALYAENAGTYTKIATLNPTTSAITLEDNPVTKDVLNAIGYTPNYANLNTEMRSWVGLAVQNSATCNLATRVKDLSFLTGWQRPINMIPEKASHMVDANTNGNKIYAVDLFKLFDWRGVKDAGATTDEGKMWDENQWFWAYYGVNKIKIDVNPAHVKTNMHFGGADGLTDYPNTLSQASTAAELYAVKANGQNEIDNTTPVEISFDLSDYKSASKNADLIAEYFADDAAKAKLGGIFYKNNGDNVSKFTVVIPITICYTWGEFTTMIPVVIDRTIQ